MSDEASREALRQQLRQLLGKVPPSIASGGSVQAVRQFKEFHSGAMKVVNSTRATVQQLAAAINKARSYYA